MPSIDVERAPGRWDLTPRPIGSVLPLAFIAIHCILILGFDTSVVTEDGGTPRWVIVLATRWALLWIVLATAVASMMFGLRRELLPWIVCLTLVNVAMRVMGGNRAGVLADAGLFVLLVGAVQLTHYAARTQPRVLTGWRLGLALAEQITAVVLIAFVMSWFVAHAIDVAAR